MPDSPSSPSINRRSILVLRAAGLIITIVLVAIVAGYCQARLYASNYNLGSLWRNPLNYGLMADYSFSEGSGTTTADRSGNGYNLSKSAGSPSWTTSGHTGDALLFTTKNDGYSISTTALALTTAFTLMGWVYPTTDPGSGEYMLASYVSNGPDFPYGIEVFDYDVTSGQPSCYYHQSGTTYPAANAPSKVTLNTWTHIACTFDGTNINLYVNGVLQTTTNAPGTIVEGTSGSLFLGADGTGDYAYKGRLDDVRLYNRALSAAEISIAMNTAVTP